MEWFRGPIFGVCLGNQLLAMAAGARTFKLPYGHRSVNQPVRDLVSGRSFITSLTTATRWTKTVCLPVGNRGSRT